MSEVATDAVVVDRLTFGYPRSLPIIRELNLSIGGGRIVALLGPNGSGKTTLLKLIARILAPNAGRVRATGAVGFVPQLMDAAISYSVFDMVLMGRARHVGAFSVPTR